MGSERAKKLSPKRSIRKATDRQIADAYKRGWNEGMEQGKYEAQKAIKKALGIKDEWL